MSLDNIITLAGKFDNAASLEAYCNSQYTTIQKLQEEIVFHKKQLEHLQQLLMATNPLTTELIVKSSEQTICEVEIERLREVSMKRNLTLEETKRFDLLVKNLLLIKGEDHILEADFTKLPAGVSESNLLEIAATAFTEPT